MRRACVALAIIAFAAPAAAGPETIDGVVVDGYTHRPIAFAVLHGQHAGYVEAASDGTFTLPLVGDVTIQVSSAGYLDATIEVASLPRTGARIELQEYEELISVTARAPTLTKSLSYDLTATDVQLVPGAGNDLLRAAAALPGVGAHPVLVRRPRAARHVAARHRGVSRRHRGADRVSLRRPDLVLSERHARVAVARRPAGSTSRTGARRAAWCR